MADEKLKFQDGYIMKQKTRKEMAISVLKSLENADSAAVESAISAKSYIQHNPHFPDGQATLLDALGMLKETGTIAKPVRVFEDGDYVFAHTEYFLFGKHQAGFDIFRFENGKIVEHWDNLQELVQKTASGHSMLDGPVEIRDKDKTVANKALVLDFATSVLQGKDLAKFPSFFNGDTFIQHNPLVADGVSGLSAALGEFARKGMALRYTETHMILGEGNFVLAAGEGYLGPQPVTYYDLFRVENGKIAEHWDVIEPVLPADQQKNSNGKF
jgi:predicted SnoaL-like aldol condensation-catalyzing enzyme